MRLNYKNKKRKNKKKKAPPSYLVCGWKKCVWCNVFLFFFKLLKDWNLQCRKATVTIHFVVVVVRSETKYIPFRVGVFNDNRKYKENCTIPTESSQNEVISFFVVFLFSVIQLGNKYELKVGLSDGRKSLLSPLNIRFTKIGLKFVFFFCFCAKNNLQKYLCYKWRQANCISLK